VRLCQDELAWVPFHAFQSHPTNGEASVEVLVDGGRAVRRRGDGRLTTLRVEGRPSIVRSPCLQAKERRHIN